MKATGIALLLTIGVTLLPSLGRASVAREITFDEKVLQADQIVMGRCVGQRASLDLSGRWILTYSTFRVEKAYKGAPGPALTVVTPGGVVGSLHQETVGVPRFGEGDREILFIRLAPMGAMVLFFDQGAYRVLDEGAAHYIAPADSSLVVVDRSTGRAHAVRDEQPRSIAEFESAIARLVQQGKGRGR